MTRYIGLDAHATTCTFAVVGPNGKRLRTDVVETNGQALVEYVKLIPKPRQLCMEEGTQCAWLYELLSPHVDELVVAGVEQSKGQKSDARDAYGLAEALRLGAIRARVYKAVGPYGKLRELGHMHGKVVGDHVRSINRLMGLFRSRGLSVEKAELMDGDKREELLKALPEKMRESADILFAESAGIGEQRKRRNCSAPRKKPEKEDRQGPSIHDLPWAWTPRHAQRSSRRR